MSVDRERVGRVLPLSCQSRFSSSSSSPSVLPLLLLCLSTGFHIDSVLAQQNTDIYFPGRTNTNTNSVHNVAADLNRNTVLAFIGQPLQVDLPAQTNPFKITSEWQGAPSQSNAPQPIAAREGFVAGHQQQTGQTFPASPNIIHQFPTDTAATGRPPPLTGVAATHVQRPLPSNNQVIRPPVPVPNSVPNAQQAFFSPPTIQSRPPPPPATTPHNPYTKFAYELFAVRSHI